MQSANGGIGTGYAFTKLGILRKNKSQKVTHSWFLV